MLTVTRTRSSLQAPPLKTSFPFDLASVFYSRILIVRGCGASSGRDWIYRRCRCWMVSLGLDHSSSLPPKMGISAYVEAPCLCKLTQVLSLLFWRWCLAEVFEDVLFSSCPCVRDPLKESRASFGVRQLIVIGIFGEKCISSDSCLRCGPVGPWRFTV